MILPSEYALCSAAIRLQQLCCYSRLRGSDGQSSGVDRAIARHSVHLRCLQHMAAVFAQRALANCAVKSYSR